ncbi:autotransporter domain-containing protein [Gallibacterium trehalosifermentans]|uniref:Autotransporter domain-containing protein n=1 Tax=Gallibacterium trehalosifermentans TaxID=516935 RepID=A0ABV6GYD6_9PAST
MIANSYVAAEDGENLLTFTQPIQLGNSSLTLGSGIILKPMPYEDDVIAGGSKLVNVNGSAVAKKTALTINGYQYERALEVDQESPEEGMDRHYDNRVILGGNMVEIAKKDNMQADQNFSSSITTEETSLTINGGMITDPVVGGSVAHNFHERQDGEILEGFTNAQVSVIDKKTNVVINGGTFKSFNPEDESAQDIYAGGAALGLNTTSTIDEANLTINGGMFYGNVFAGSYVEDAGIANVKKSTITINNGEINGSIVAGGECESECVTDTAQDNLGKSTVENVTLNLRGGKVGGILLGGVNQDSVLAAPVKQAVLNYYGGEITRPTISDTAEGVESGIDAIAENATINLYADLTSDVLADAQSNVTIQGNQHTLNGDLSAIDNATLTINNVNFSKKQSLTVGRLGEHQQGTINLANDQAMRLDNLTFKGTAAGQFNLTKGELSGVLKIDGDSNVNLTGATYTSQDLANDLIITAGKNGKLVLKENGVIKTLANQLFNDGEATKAENLDTLAVKDEVNNKINFAGGTVKLEDSKYAFNYAKKAKEVFSAGNSRQSTLTFTGELTDKALQVSQAAELGNEMALDSATANTSKANLIVGSNAATEVSAVQESAENVNNGFNVGKLNLAADSTLVAINNLQEVTLGGSEGGEVLVVNNQANTDLQVFVGSGNQNKGGLNVGNTSVDETTALTLTANVILTSDSQLTSRGKTTINGDVVVDNSSIAVANGTLTLAENKTLTTKGTSTFTGNIHTDNLKVDQQDTAAIINIGSTGAAGKAGKVTAKNVDLNGGILFLDPIWQNGQTIADGTAFATNSVNNTKVVVGNNAVFVYGTDTQTAYNTFNQTGLTWGDNATLSAAYLSGSLDLAANSLVIDPTAQSTSGANYGTLKLADNSLLMIDGAKVNGSQTAALTNVSSAEVAANAHLYLANVNDGETYHIMSGTQVETNNSWYVAEESDAPANISTYQALYKLVGATGNNATKLSLVAKLQKANAIYGNSLLMPDVIDNTLANHTDTPLKGFFDKAMNSQINATQAAQIDAFNSAAAMSVLGKSSYGTYKAATLINDSVVEHLRVDDREYGNNVWLRYLHSNEDINNVNSVIAENSQATHHGLVLGADLYRHAKNSAGVALSYLHSKYDSLTLASHTKNKAKYIGLSAYGRTEIAGLALLADASYFNGKNSLNQYNSGERLTGTQRTAAISLGATVEKTVAFANDHTLTPYVGVRYLHLDSSNYRNNLGLNYRQDQQDLWLLPVGVKYQAAFTSGDWLFKPSVELGYTWNSGDRQAKQTVAYQGVTNSFNYNIVDKGNFVSKVGFDAKQGQFVYSLGYEYQKGRHVKANRYVANVSYQF